jgi:hypothetical protein
MSKAQLEDAEVEWKPLLSSLKEWMGRYSVMDTRKDFEIKNAF